MNPVLDPGHRLLVCLAVATRSRDRVLFQQVAERAEQLMTDREMNRAFSRLATYGCGSADIDWLRTLDH